MILRAEFGFVSQQGDPGTDDIEPDRLRLARRFGPARDQLGPVLIRNPLEFHLKLGSIGRNESQLWVRLAFLITAKLGSIGIFGAAKLGSIGIFGAAKLGSIGIFGAAKLGSIGQQGRSVENRQVVKDHRAKKAPQRLSKARALCTR